MLKGHALTLAAAVLNMPYTHNQFVMSGQDFIFCTWRFGLCWNLNSKANGKYEKASVWDALQPTSNTVQCFFHPLGLCREMTPSHEHCLQLAALNSDTESGWPQLNVICSSFRARCPWLPIFTGFCVWAVQGHCCSVEPWLCQAQRVPAFRPRVLQCSMPAAKEQWEGPPSLHCASCLSRVTSLGWKHGVGPECSSSAFMQQ